MTTAFAIVTIEVTKVDKKLPWWYCVPKTPPIPCPVRPTGFIPFADYDVGFKYPIASSRMPSKIQKTDEEGCVTCSPKLIEQPLGIAPTNVTPPSFLYDNYDCGLVMETTGGEWAGDEPITYTYQWFRGDSGDYSNPIDGATDSTYISPNGGPLFMRITATNAAGFVESETEVMNVSCS